MEALLCYVGSSGLCVWLAGKKLWAASALTSIPLRRAVNARVLALQESIACSLKETVLLCSIIALEVINQFHQGFNVFSILITNNIVSQPQTLGV